MYKLSHLKGDIWVEHSYPPIFQLELTNGKPRRLRIGVPVGDPIVIRRLVSKISAPFLLLYILHTPRGEGESGRYQSSDLDYAELDAFLTRYGKFLSGDARHDLWIHSPDSNATVVWDRHNMAFAYGPLEQFTQELRSLGFQEGVPEVPAPHQHHYRQEFDTDAGSILSALNWMRTPLRPEDEQ